MEARRASRLPAGDRKQTGVRASTPAKACHAPWPPSACENDLRGVGREIVAQAASLGVLRGPAGHG